MILTIYIIILAYFVLGAVGFFFINRKKDPLTARENRNKFITYFIIIHILFLGIVFNPVGFKILGMVIILVGLWEIINLFRQSGYAGKGFFGLFLLIFLIFCTGFFRFSNADQGLILFTFLLVSIFDAFSQIIGQLLGKQKISPSISPGKTTEGFIGGTLIAIASSLLLRGLIDARITEALLISTGIVIFAFIGDMGISLYKRKYRVKDFGNLLPGHGGFMDRFDSLIAGGAFIALLELLGA